MRNAKLSWKHLSKINLFSHKLFARVDEVHRSRITNAWVTWFKMSILFSYCTVYDITYNITVIIMHTHIHTHSTALFLGLPGWAGTRKVKPIWIVLKQETVSGSGISWAICKPAPRTRPITKPAPHHSVFTGGCPSCRPTNSVKALKACYNMM